MQLLGCATRILVFLIMLYVAFANQPGAKLRVSQNGLNYANTVAGNILRNYLLKTPIKNQSGGGKYPWSLSNIMIRGVSGPTTQFGLHPGHGGLTFAISNFGVNLQADYRIKYKILFFFPISFSGKVSVSITGSSLSLVLGLGQNNGRPVLSPKFCNSYIGSVNLRFSGGLSAFILNLFSGKVSNIARSSLQDSTCKAVNELIEKNANTELATYKVKVEFLDRFILDYGLVAPPIVTSSYLEALSRGAVYWKDNIHDSPFSPNVIPDWTDVKNMAYMFLTEYIPNTFLYMAHRYEFLKYNFTLKDLPIDHEDIMNSSSEIGLLLPSPVVEFRIVSKEAPMVKLDHGNLTVSAVGEVKVVDHRQNDTTSVLLKLSVNVSVTLEPSIRNDSLTAVIVDHSFNVDIIDSNVNEIDPQELKRLIEKGLTIMIIPRLNEYLKKGMDLPKTADISFYNANLIPLPGVLLVSADIRYKL